VSGINFKYSQGRSLVELMIAMTIGLVISLAVTSLFVNNSKTYKTFDDKSVMEEDGRMALNTIAYHIRMAETGPPKNTTTQGAVGAGASEYDQLTGQAISGCSGGYISPVAPANPALPFPVPCNPSATGPDSIALRYIVDSDNSNAAAASAAAVTDCLGQIVPETIVDGASKYTVENRYYIAVNPATTRSEMYCAGNGGVPIGTPFLAGKPIVENVVDMKIVYGYDPMNQQSVNGFFNAAELMEPTVPMPVLPPGWMQGDPVPPKWSRIASAKVCLVMRSANDGLTPKPMSYTNCSGTVVTAPDKRLYSTFTTVVSVRGRTSGRSL